MWSKARLVIKLRVNGERRMKMENLTPKEITLSYLESIKKDYENAFDEAIKATWSTRMKRASAISLAKSINSLSEVINIVQESEGE